MTDKVKEELERKREQVQRELRCFSLAIAGLQIVSLKVVMGLEDDMSKCLLMTGIYNVSEEEVGWLESREDGGYTVYPPGYWVWLNLREVVLGRLGRDGCLWPQLRRDGLWVDHINQKDVAMVQMQIEQLAEERIDVASESQYRTD